MKNMELLNVHKTYSGASMPDVVLEVPGVNRYTGVFAECSSGKVLCSVNNLSLFIAISKRTDGLLFCTNCLTGEHKKFQSSSLKYKKEDKWGNYVKAVFVALEKKIKNFRGVTITLEGLLLSADYDTVRSAIALGVLSVVKKLFGVSLDHAEMRQILYSVFGTFCLETVPQANLLTLLYAKKNSFVLVDLETAEYKVLSNPFKKTSEYGFYVLDGKVPPGPVREELQSIRDSLNVSMKEFRLYFKKNSFKNFDINRLKSMLFMGGEASFGSEHRKLCRYMYSEQRNTEDIEAAIENKDVVRFGKVLSRNQKDIKEGLELICPEIDWIVKRLLDEPACTGAGFASNGTSGVVAFVMKNAELDSFREKIQMYEHIFGFKARLYSLDDTEVAHFTSPKA